MKIPESVRIGGVEYTISFEEHLNDKTHLCYGCISYEDSEIKLSSDRGTGHEFRCITLWHEILHGICEHAGLEIEDEEKIVEVLSRGVYQVLQDNGRRLFDIVSESDAP